MSDILSDSLHAEFGKSITVVVEPRPLGTGGCLSLVRNVRSAYNLVVSADLVVEMDFVKLLNFHKDHAASITLTTHPNTHPADSDLVSVEPETQRVKELYTRPHPPSFRYENLVNASVAVVNGDVWNVIEDDQESNFEKHLVKNCLSQNQPVFSYRTSEYIADMGTPDRLAKVERDIASGLVKGRSLTQRQKAVFIDRDGVLNQFRGDIINPDDIELIPGVIEALKELNRSPYLAILVTNQPHAAKGHCSLETLFEINRELETKLGNAGAKLDDVFICIHHPESGFVGEIKELKKDCDCRKPKPGMILAAAKKYNIDCSESFMIGDTSSDILAGKTAGLHTVTVETGLAGKDGKFKIEPEIRVADFAAAVRWILEEKK